MIKLKNNQKGFSAIEAFLILIVLVIIGVVGWIVYKDNHKTTTAASPQSSSKSSATATNPSQLTIALTPPSSYVSTAIKTVACSTTYGAQSNLKPLPTTTTVSLPSSLVSSRSGLGYYASTDDSTGILAPSGWTCSGTIGADGSSLFTVTPKNEVIQTNQYGSPEFNPQTDPEAIEVSWAGQTVGAQPACLYFSQAVANLPGPNCGANPTGQTHTLLSSTVASFIDPSGVRGTGASSGGTNESLGIITYDDTRGSWVASCTLPASERSICTSAMTDVLNRYWKN